MPSSRIRWVGAGAVLGAVASLLAIGLVTSVLVDRPHGGPSGHGGHDTHSMTLPSASVALSETGQSAFAALAETVAALMADPDTDWSAVDVGALRDHLVSMDRLVLEAVVETEPLDTGHRFVISGEGRTRRAIDEMVPAHAAVLAADTPWSIEARRENDAVVLVVESDDPDERARIAALGFFGLMALGEHHRAHHWAMVNGHEAHGH